MPPRIAAGDAQALWSWGDLFVRARSDAIARIALSRKIPSISSIPGFAEIGGLCNYAPDPAEFMYLTASFVDRILKGALPADLPVHQVFPSAARDLNLVPGAGGVCGGPAKHWACAIQRAAASPRTTSRVSATLRVCVTTWQNSTALPSTSRSSSVSFHRHCAPDGAVSRTWGGGAGGASPRLRNVQPKVLTPRNAML
jgi:hypothetical protein